ncbi:MAG TPA: Xaa-Pro peptidase family protein [Candidatus Angelobacter sp.]|nr:Xaa-Pro peptidase family protein [Candidatus Angelobacter sp.]
MHQAMRADRLNAFVVTHLPNIFYLTGFSGSSGIVSVTGNGAILFTDPRYAIQAKQEVTAAQVRIVRGSLLNAVGEQLEQPRDRRIGFEAAHLTVLQKAALGKSTGARTRWIPWDGKVEGLRVIKDESELVTMREAARIACSSWEETVPLVKPGVSEIELAAEIEFRMRRKGADGPAFDTIIASGERGAWPHARASRKLVRKNELVVFDLGAILRGYSSDLTRTVCVGRASSEKRRWYGAVLRAQQAARQALRPGVTAEQVDAAARGVLKQAGLERRFIHSTGHGLGLEVHESPRLGRGDQSVLRAGTVVTLEPGVYVEGTGGIRIEDDALVTNTGAEFLTHANRELIEIG